MIRDIRTDRLGKEPLTRFPNLMVEDQLRYFELGIKRVRLLYYLEYNKERAKEKLNETFGWEWYGGHHAENKYTKFIGGYLWAYKFGQDLRYVQYSALIRSGQMKREMAWRLIHHPQYVEGDILNEIKRRLILSGEEVERILNSPIKQYRD